jgi:hypothetical protein
MVRIACIAAAGALALLAGGRSSAADGSISSLSDLDSGASQWQAIAPHSGNGPQSALTSVDRTHAVGAHGAGASRNEREIGANLSIETPPPPPRKPAEGPLWYSKP